MHDRCEPLDWLRELLPGADLFDPAPEKGTTCTSTPRQRATKWCTEQPAESSEWVCQPIGGYFFGDCQLDTSDWSIHCLGQVS